MFWSNQLQCKRVILDVPQDFQGAPGCGQLSKCNVQVLTLNNIIFPKNVSLWERTLINVSSVSFHKAPFPPWNKMTQTCTVLPGCENPRREGEATLRHGSGRENPRLCWLTKHPWATYCFTIPALNKTDREPRDLFRPQMIRGSSWRPLTKTLDTTWGAERPPHLT